MSEKKLRNCKFINGSVLDIPLSSEFADSVLFIESIEHLNGLDEVNKAIDEIKRILKPNGQVIIAMPDFSSLAGRIMERLYKVFHPQAYADDHKVKIDDYKLVSICERKGLALKNHTNLFKRDVIMAFWKK
jgi:predicted SAM-dependent methyltransferase